MNWKFIVITLKKKGKVGFVNYLEGEKLCGFCILYTGALFYKGLRVRYACESIAGINCIVARYNRYASYNICASPKLWRELNENY